MSLQRAAPAYIRVNPRDNVAIIVSPEGLPARTQLSDGLTLLDAIPQAHKVALCDIGEGHPVIRYGHTIAFATRNIKRGSWVREDFLRIPDPPSPQEWLRRNSGQGWLAEVPRV